jgi:hypothetical protein
MRNNRAVNRWGQCCALAALLGAAIVGGCGDTPEMTEESMNAMQDKGEKARQIFDAVNGDYDAMTPEQKKDYMSINPSWTEADARMNWDFMKNPPGGAPMGPSTGR